MSDEDRRVDDARISDIQRTMHNLDVRVTRVEVQQEAQGQAATENYAHIGRRIDTLQSSLQASVENVHADVLRNREDHKSYIERDAENRKQIVARLSLMLWTIVLALGTWGLSKLAEVGT